MLAKNQEGFSTHKIGILTYRCKEEEDFPRDVQLPALSPCRTHACANEVACSNLYLALVQLAPQTPQFLEDLGKLVCVRLLRTWYICLRHRLCVLQTQTCVGLRANKQVCCMHVLCRCVDAAGNPKLFTHLHPSCADWSKGASSASAGAFSCLIQGGRGTLTSSAAFLRSSDLPCTSMLLGRPDGFALVHLCCAFPS